MHARQGGSMKMNLTDFTTEVRRTRRNQIQIFTAEIAEKISGPASGSEREGRRVERMNCASVARWMLGVHCVLSSSFPEFQIKTGGK
jgi:hypothetical protein